MKKVITEVDVTVTVLGQDDKVLRVEGGEWVAEDEDISITQQQLRDVIDYLWQFLDTPPVYQTNRDTKIKVV